MNNKISTYAKKAVLLMIVIGMLYIGITSVFGVQGATGIDVGASSQMNLTNWSSSATTAAEAGNVTQINLSGQSITTHWAGFFGDVSGNLTLGDSSGNVFYDWTGIGTPEGEVFASTDNSLNWSGIGCASAAEISTLDTALGIDGTDADSVNATYDSNSHPSLTIGAVSGISGCNSTNAYIDSGQDATSFYQILLTDTEGDEVYTTVINDSTTGFDGVSHDFQLLVGESDAGGTTAMYFYIELD